MGIELADRREDDGIWAMKTVSRKGRIIELAIEQVLGAIQGPLTGGGKPAKTRCYLMGLDPSNNLKAPPVKLPRHLREFTQEIPWAPEYKANGGVLVAEVESLK